MSGAYAGKALKQSITCVARCSRPQSLRVRAQHQAFKPMVRSFTASTRSTYKHCTSDKPI